LRFRRTVHGNAPDDVLTQVLGDLQDELVAAVVGSIALVSHCIPPVYYSRYIRERIENGRELLGVELDLQSVVSSVFVMRAVMVDGGAASQPRGKVFRGGLVLSFLTSTMAPMT
jgi:hypothetical protein